jgi:hypothetical protein
LQLLARVESFLVFPAFWHLDKQKWEMFDYDELVAVRCDNGCKLLNANKITFTQVQGPQAFQKMQVSLENTIFIENTRETSGLF